MTNVKIAEQVEEILTLYFIANLSGVVTEFKSEKDIYEDIANYAATVLTDRFVNEAYTPMETMAITNAITKMLDTIFFPK